MTLNPAQPCAEFPWLAYHCICAEQCLEEESNVWITLLKWMKKDPKLSVDAALKVSVTIATVNKCYHSDLWPSSRPLQ